MGEVLRPKRVLAVSLEDQEDRLSRVITELTGSAPQSAESTLAGTTHTLALKTRYYSASIPLWIDLISSPQDWAASFLSEEAAEVLAVLGGLVVVFALPTDLGPGGSGGEVGHLIRQIGRVVNEGLGGWDWDGVRLAVGIGQGEADDWHELCAEAGLEFVHLDHIEGGDEIGGKDGLAADERAEKTGMARVREALEANDWEQEPAAMSAIGKESSEMADEGEDEGLGGGETDTSDPIGFAIESADMDGLREAILKGATAGGDGGEDSEDREEEGDEKGVAKVEEMMKKLQAVREAGEGLSPAQRRKLAAQAVGEVMRELG